MPVGEDVVGYVRIYNVPVFSHFITVIAASDVLPLLYNQARGLGALVDGTRTRVQIGLLCEKDAECQTRRVRHFVLMLA